VNEWNKSLGDINPVFDDGMFSNYCFKPNSNFTTY
jgi:hypothetical protein